MNVHFTESQLYAIIFYITLLLYVHEKKKKIIMTEFNFFDC